MVKTLLFPGGMQESLDMLDSLGKDQVIGASSLLQDPVQIDYQFWEVLPFIHEESFEREFFKLVQKHQITQVFSPHKVIWRYFEELLSKYFPEIQLLGSSPLSLIIDKHRGWLQRSFQSSTWGMKLNEAARPSLTSLQLSSVFKHAHQIEGESDDVKIGLLCEIARSMPAYGDIVEIGSAWGRSAFVLLQLSRHYQLGNVLCVDPWSSEQALQSESESIINLTLRAMTQSVDFEEIFEAFIMNLWPYHNDRLNYLKLPSDLAFQLYSHLGFSVNNGNFGETHYQGKIACLHIDGNHDYSVVKTDIQEWSSRLIPGGWLLIDDYIWACGDGPKRAGDEYLEEYKDKIRCAFVVGTTLCIQLCDSYD